MDVDRLRELPLFGELDHHDLSIVARWVKEVELSDGDLLFEQGSMPHELFVLERGRAEVSHDGDLVASLGPGDVVGEMALLKLQRRWATVRAIGDVRAVTLDSDALAAITEEMPELGERLREIMARRESENEG
jgi:CRP/FNR family cyclic AMP-dependent transcriptional regulator